MAQDHLQAGHAVEYASEDEAKELDTHLIVPAEAVGGEGYVHLGRETGIVGSSYRDLRRSRMEQDRRAQRLRALENGREAWIVEVAGARPSAQHSSLEAERPNAAL